MYNENSKFEREPVTETSGRWVEVRHSEREVVAHLSRSFAEVNFAEAIAHLVRHSRHRLVASGIQGK